MYICSIKSHIQKQSIMKNLSTIISIARDVQEDLPSKMQIDQLEEKILQKQWITENDAIQYFYGKCDELGLQYS